MSTIAEHAKDIFLEAVEKHAPEEWPEFLDKACGDDDKLRQRVQALLQAHADNDSLFDAVAPTVSFNSDEKAGEMIGPYKLRERLGAGGMGVVWAAERKKPMRQKVALKVIKPGMDSEQVIARFEAEREALAMMDHPNIAKVLNAGTTDQGRPYFVMELIRGLPITEYCDNHGLSVTARLNLFIQVCKAVQHAHQKGIIHRDIKPSNVLITEHDGTPVPKVIDFGVAKALHRSLTDGSIYTGVFQAVGTLPYMSPEQATLSGTGVDTCTDVYGLGVLLYVLLTGTTPFDQQQLEQAALDEALRIIREEDAPSPSMRISTLGGSLKVSHGQRKDASELGKIVRGDLDCIVMKALQKDRNRRYRTADALAADIARHLAHEPVQARPPSMSYRLGRFYRRNRVVAGTATFVFCITLIATVAMTAALLEANRQRTLLVASEAQTTAKNYDYAMSSACDAFIAGNLDRTEALLKECIPEHRDAQDLRGLEWRYLWTELQAGRKALAERHSHKDRSFSHGIPLAYTANGEFLYFVDRDEGLVRHRVGSAPSDWSEVSMPALFDHARIHRIAFLGGSEHLLVEAELSQDDVSYDLLDVSTGKTRHLFSQSSDAQNLRVSPDGNSIAVASRRRPATLALYDVSSGEAIWEKVNKQPTVTSLVFSSEGKYLVTAGYAKTVSVRLAETGIELIKLTHESMAHSARFSEDGTRLYTFGNFGTKIWSVGEFACIGAQARSEGDSSLPKFGRASETSALNESRSTIRVLGGQDEWETIAKLPHRYQVGFSLSPCGRELATIDEFDGSLRVWDLVQYRRNMCRSNGSIWFKPLAISPADGTFAIAGPDSVVRLWRPGSDHPIDLESHGGAVKSVAFFPDGSKLVSSGMDNRIIIWDVETREQIRSIATSHRGGIWAISLSADGRRLASGDMAAGVQIWDLSAFTSVTIPADPDGIDADIDEVYSLDFSVDDQRLAVSGWNNPNNRWTGHVEGVGVTRIWDVEEQRWLMRSEHDGRVDSVAYSPDGKWLAAGDRSGQITLWDATTMDQVFRRRVSNAFVASVTFSPDSTRLLSASDNGQIQIYRLPDGAEVGRIQTPDALRRIAFTRDGSGIGTESVNGVARLVKVATWEEIKQEPDWWSKPDRPGKR